MDGLDLREAATGEVRGQMGFVTQDPLLFNDSVSANIALFDPNVDPERVAISGRNRPRIGIH